MPRKTGTTAIERLLKDERLRKTELGDCTYYAAVDVVALLSDSADPAVEWEELKHFEPSLLAKSQAIELPGSGEPQDVLPLAGVMRLIQSIDSPRAERLRAWIAAAAAERVKEEADPELAVQRMRQDYRDQGRTRQWIDQRLRSISARHEIVGEWYRRGASQNEQFRTLTNQLMQAAFGMDVNAYRQDRGIGKNLRDHLGALELSLLSLAETTAAALHRQRESTGMDELMRDVHEAGQIISQTRRQIMKATTPEPSLFEPAAF
jgi:DNA-damage-inducible protein D